MEEKENIFSIVAPIAEIKDKEFSDYTVNELCSYIVTLYPEDPLGALKIMMDNLQVGYVLGNKAKFILEGYKC